MLRFVLRSLELIPDSAPAIHLRSQALRCQVLHFHIEVAHNLADFVSGRIVRNVWVTLHGGLSDRVAYIPNARFCN